ncbi:hypothetical protein LC613_15160 [Nostoc sphaeroides CHAB 2801]|uniref:hypothetical protein n=1 Tax=Nostoc sphaeroides TaxID=446679 RepID=UPI000E50E479|nr:hypothetical protein [Nostoc sphaeroides]MCC5629336.1 hypothetical protein [Nostoc sphaeroides CHAB 2801]
MSDRTCDDEVDVGDRSLSHCLKEAIANNKTYTCQRLGSGSLGILDSSVFNFLTNLFKPSLPGILHDYW